jgi:hypothetical protein
MKPRPGALFLSAAAAVLLAGACATAPRGLDARAAAATPAPAASPAADIASGAVPASSDAAATVPAESPPAQAALTWTDEAKAAFEAEVPAMVKKIARKSMEKKARERGIEVIDIAFYDEIKKEQMGN